MLTKIQINGLFLNLIIYLIMIAPIVLISFKKSIYESKQKFVLFSIILTFIETLASIILYNFSKNIFLFFTDITGIINYAVYSSKILFISSSFYTLKILLPIYIAKKDIKKAATLVLSKIATNLILIIIGYNLFDTKGLLYSFPICDIIYYIIYFKVFLNVFR